MPSRSKASIKRSKALCLPARNKASIKEPLGQIQGIPSEALEPLSWRPSFTGPHKCKNRGGRPFTRPAPVLAALEPLQGLRGVRPLHLLGSVYSEAFTPSQAFTPSRVRVLTRGGYPFYVYSTAARLLPPSPLYSTAARLPPPSPLYSTAARLLPPSPLCSTAARLLPPSPICSTDQARTRLGLALYCVYSTAARCALRQSRRMQQLDPSHQPRATSDPFRVAGSESSAARDGCGAGAGAASRRRNRVQPVLLHRGSC